MLPIIKINNSQILDIAKSPQIANSRKFKHAKITLYSIINVLKLVNENIHGLLCRKDYFQSISLVEILLCLSSHRDVGTCGFTFVRSACVCAFPPMVQAVKHETLTQCWANVGTPSATLAQHQTSTGSTLRVCWVSFCQSVLW